MDQRHARERGLTLRQVALEAASPRPRFTGTASDVADGLQLWFEQHAADGFIIQGGTPETFPRFVDEVVPLLQARGLSRRDYPGTTLRENHLKVLTEFMPISARLIANRASYQFRRREIDTLVQKLAEVMEP